MIDDFISFLRLFRQIPQEDCELIASELSCRSVAENEVLTSPGQVCRELFFITKGVLRIVAQNEKGNQIAYFFLKENQFCSILNSFYNEVPATEGIEAACAAELIVIRRQKLISLFERLPYLKELITGIHAQSLMDKIQLRNAYLGEDAATRYRNFLVRQPEIALRISLGDIASYLGVTQQSLSRIRKNMH